MSGLKSRRKGHSFELAVRDFFRALGWSTAVSSRSESRAADAAGKDLVYTDPFNVQCKAVEKLGNLHSVLEDMPKDNNINLVFHKRKHAGVVVAMTMEDFKKVIHERDWFLDKCECNKD